MIKENKERSGKRIIRTSAVIMFILLSLLPMLSPVSAIAATTISIGDVTVPQGENVTVPIMITNVTNVGVASLMFSYNPSVVHVTAVTDSAFDVCEPTINNNTGEFLIGGVQMQNEGLNGTVRLANVTLKAVGSAGQTSSLNLVIDELKTAAASSQNIPADVDNGTFAIADGGHDINVSTDYAGAVNGINITRDGTDVVGANDSLTIGESYNVRYKLVNAGNFNESVKVNVTAANATGWNETIGTHNYTVKAGGSDTYSDSWNTSGLVEGTYTLKVNASIPVDNNTGNNERARNVTLVGPGVQELANITISPSEAMLRVSETQQFTATAKDQNGIEMTGVVFNWTSSNETVGTINVTGFFTANATTGTTTVKAANGTVNGTATVTVGYVSELANITISPSEATLRVSETQQFTATAEDQNGTEMTGVVFNWTSSNETVGTINVTGFFTANATTGRTTVKAANGTVNGTAAVTVYIPEFVNITISPSEATRNVNETQQFTATAKDQYNNVMTGVVFNWTSSNETVGTINVTGFFTANAAGTTTVKAANGTVNGTATVTVGYVSELANITISPSEAMLRVNETQQFTATAKDQNGTEMTGVVFNWTSSNETVGTINGTGFFTANATTGRTTVKAANGTVNGTAAVTVYMPEFVNITISPSEATLRVNETKQFTATAKDQNGIEMTGVVFNWTSSNITVGTINNTGLFTANATGTTTIKAANGTVNGTAIVTVGYASELANITILPSEATLTVSETQPFTATAKDQNGTEMTGVVFNWTSSNITVGTINNTGLFTANATGTTTIKAANGTVNGTAAVTVYVPELANIIISPSEATRNVSETQQFTATAKDQYNNVMTGVVFNWTSSNITVGTINDTGLFTANATGTTTVKAANGTVNGTAIMTVITPMPITPTPTPPPVRRGGGGGRVVTDLDGDGYTDLEEMIVDTDQNNPCDPDPNCAACLKLKAVTPAPVLRPTPPAEEVTPTPPAEEVIPTPPAEEVTPTPTPKIPGFESVFAIAGLLAVAYLVLRKRK